MSEQPGDEAKAGEPADAPDASAPDPSASDGPTPDDASPARVAPRVSALGRAIAAGRSSGAKGDAAKSGPAKRRRSVSSTRRDSRDPALLGDVVADFVEQQGWQHASAHATLAGDWARIVGPELAEHLRIESLDDEGVLRLVASSTAWATNVSYVLPQLRTAIDEAVGRGVVADIKVRGPQAPSWTSGPRRVKGRGPRDTYG